MATPMHPLVQPAVHRLDATGISLGRLATRIADLLRGKTEPTFTSHLVHDIRVIVTNAHAVRFTGRKLEQKIYYRHTGYLGHLKEQHLKDLFAKEPDEVIRRAVTGMLPKNRLQKLWLKNLEVWPKEEGAHHGR
ncbi:50S ribosomal protein L13 [Candidatus Berkelbacteria bacterium]|nr:50S ribosomal protein L13 [Candidatus Berkelbacteria bacterium]